VKKSQAAQHCTHSTAQVQRGTTGSLNRGLMLQYRVVGIYLGNQMQGCLPACLPVS
jgi:hypothetical protein